VASTEDATGAVEQARVLVTRRYVALDEVALRVLPRINVAHTPRRDRRGPSRARKDDGAVSYGNRTGHVIELHVVDDD
jgi:hypothetical protein